MLFDVVYVLYNVYLLYKIDSCSFKVDLSFSYIYHDRWATGATEATLALVFSVSVETWEAMIPLSNSYSGV